jgi:uncharacterized protein (DUF433 family)
MIRIESPLMTKLEEEARERGQRLDTLVSEIIDEGLRMRRVPGIVFTDGPAGRRATITGCGIDVWEVIATWNSLGQDAGKLRENYHWLSDSQICAALTYYQAYPAEVDTRLAREAILTPEHVYEMYTFLDPRRK